VKPQIGEIILFKIDTSDFGVWRPLLVTFVHDDGTVDGELFLCWERDRRAEWPSKHLFWGLDPQHRNCEVRNVKPGEEVGNYKSRSGELEEIFNGITRLGDRLSRLEEIDAKRGKLQQPQPPAKAMVAEKRLK